MENPSAPDTPETGVENPSAPDTPETGMENPSAPDTPGTGMENARVLELLYELYAGTPRQGPGSAASTARALAACAGLPPRPDVLDLGCGSGAQTIDLARLTEGRVTGVDNHGPFLDELLARAAREGLGGRVAVKRADMARPGFADGSFDLVWSEGAVYSIGFERGLAAWRRLVRQGGCVAVSEIVFLSGDVPTECRNYWLAEYPDMKGTGERMDQARRLGYEVLDGFVLDPRCWLEEYYGPLAVRMEEMARKYPADNHARRVIDMTRREIMMYERYGAHFGYVFLVLRRA